MRIEAKLESIAGAWSPVLFFPDVRETDKTIQAYSPKEGHSYASRAYMRQCKEPDNPGEYALVFQALARYFADATRYASR